MRIIELTICIIQTNLDRNISISVRVMRDGTLKVTQIISVKLHYILSSRDNGTFYNLTRLSFTQLSQLMHMRNGAIEWLTQVLLY